ncbi:MAG: glycosyltransferase family 39 protein [Gammaproteobacteria bacterium]|nr:glycosyltransferase family 39 protein [Gammaproteobacteria bacterium]MBU1602596.1 glycosyltransferase family 39 protein [Gammaproteobacteria bacterium]MBU2433401.1 glycosyltransferase family 39 protein [Gammaproteobacteria bacterium]MBU2451317.1 glycosyltransferase family 39 protein [Gammaproteobacteria bacterium]
MQFRSLPLTIERFLLSPFSLLLALFLAFVLNAYNLPLTDVDEGAFSEATREMMARGNLISPTLNDAPRHDKPILIYWAQAASVAVLGVSEIGFRLPSIVFALLWVFALFRFCVRHGNQMTAQIASLVMALTLVVGFIAKAAIADALLNLLIALAMFGIYDYFVACRDGKPAAKTRRLLFGVYAALGLGFLAKGPVAVFFPLLISGLFFVSAGAWRDWLKAVFFWPGWLLFLAIVVPWHVLVYLDQGDAFFCGFYLKHNINRYADTFEGHGGRWWYYFAVAPLILLPFTGWLLAITGKLAGALRQNDSGALLERFLIIWFVVVFAFFSFSGTQLPHYLLYGCTPVFILLARHRLDFERRWLAFLPIILFALLLAALPEVLAFAAGKATRPFEKTLISGLTVAFSDEARWLLPLLAVAVIGLAFWRRLPVWQGLVIAGLLQTITVVLVIAPRAIDVTQGPVREAAMLVKQSGETNVVAWRIIMPSFSVYRQAATPTRVPELGQLVFTRTDRKHEVQALLAPNLVLRDVYQRSFVTLARVEREGVQ